MGIRVMWAVALAAALVLTTAVAAAGQEGDVTAKQSVQQAVRILEGQPEMADLALEKVDGALNDDQTQGLDRSLVGEARSALAAGSLPEALDLLQRSLGQRPSPSSPDQREVGGGLAAPTGTAGPTLLAVAALVALVGVVVARRVR